MKKTGYLHDQRFLLHDTGPMHPEMAERLQMIHKGIEEAGLLNRLVTVKARLADMKWIEAVHDPAYIRRFEELSLAGRRTFDVADNQMCRETFETARLAVGGVLQAADMLMEGQIDNAFCAVRPPGHHAEVDKAMGFCYLNNVAILARYLRDRWQIERVAIIDFDVHHGNGTQHIFEQDPSVLYYSIHEHPSFAFPGTGRDFESGTLAGMGYTKNSPVLPGQGDDEYRRLIEKDMIPAVEHIDPQVILVSCGFDAHEDDEMADMQVTTAGFSWIMNRIVELAETHAEGRLISVLEGGYRLERLGELARNHVQILLGN